MTRVTRTTAVLASLVLVSLLAFGCGSDNGGGPVEPGPFNVLHLDLYGVDALGPGYVYQAWGAEIDTTTALAAAVGTWHKIAAFHAVSSGSGTATLFTIDDNPIANNDITGISGDMDDYDTFLVTIEPTGALPNTPTGSAYLSGRVPADLEKTSIAGIEFPFSITMAFSTYEFATPTDNIPDNDTSGIWFLREGAPRQPSLGIDDAPPGWTYEGWAMHNGTWLSTGKFTSPEGADESDQYSGTDNPAPPFPGEDFLQGQATLPWIFGSMDSVVISLEPNPDPMELSRSPLWFLGSEVPENPSLGFNHAFSSTTANFPEGNAVFKRADQ